MLLDSPLHRSTRSTKVQPGGFGSAPRHRHHTQPLGRHRPNHLRSLAPQRQREWLLGCFITQFRITRDSDARFSREGTLYAHGSVSAGQQHPLTTHTDALTDGCVRYTRKHACHVTSVPRPTLPTLDRTGRPLPRVAAPFKPSCTVLRRIVTGPPPAPPHSPAPPHAPPSVATHLCGAGLGHHPCSRRW